MFITSEPLDREGLFHGFFGRNGGVSGGIYQSLNCGYGSSDGPDHVRQNRRVITQQAGFAERALTTLSQCHSATCLTVTEPWTLDQQPAADAMVTDQPGVLLGVLTADCAPVLLCGRKQDGSHVVGAAHSGWRGAFGGVIGAVVRAMVDLGAEPTGIVATIGPCLGPMSYEVDALFRDQFVQADAQNARFFLPGERTDKFMFNLPAFVEGQLDLAGVENRSDMAIDTYQNEADYFSYRRSVHRNEPDYGRQLSVIGIKV